jgi:hypothetical protein
MNKHEDVAGLHSITKTTCYILTTVQYGEYKESTAHGNEEEILSQIETCSEMASITIESITLNGEDVTKKYI